MKFENSFETVVRSPSAMAMVTAQSTSFDITSPRGSATRFWQAVSSIRSRPERVVERHPDGALRILGFQSAESSSTLVHMCATPTRHRRITWLGRAKVRSSHDAGANPLAPTFAASEMSGDSHRIAPFHTRRLGSMRKPTGNIGALD